MIKNFILDILDFEFSKYWWQRSITRDYLEDSVLQKYESKQQINSGKYTDRVIAWEEELGDNLNDL